METNDNAPLSNDAKPNEGGESELKRLTKEVDAMIRFMKQLEKEEQQLRAQNEILAREALLCGFDPGLLEPPAPKRRKSLVKPKAEDD